MAPHSSTLAWKIPWTEVHDIVQEAVYRPFWGCTEKEKCKKGNAKEKEMQKGKMVV